MRHNIRVVPGLFSIPKTSLLPSGVLSHSDKANVTGRSFDYDGSGSLFFRGELSVLSCLPLGRCCQCQWKWFLKRRGKQNHNCRSGPHTGPVCGFFMQQSAHKISPRRLLAGWRDGRAAPVDGEHRMNVTYITCNRNVQLYRDKSNKRAENVCMCEKYTLKIY